MRIVLLTAGLIAAGVALAQRPADPPRAAEVAAERFHEAAGLFVRGDTLAAARVARDGLRVAPDDPALRALLAAIERRPPPQPRGGSGDDQPPPPPPTGSGEERNDRPGEQPNPDEGRAQGERTPEREPGDPRGAGGPERGRADQQTDGGSGRPPRMTRAEAEALLRALGADERRLLRARAGQVEPREVENEW